MDKFKNATIDSLAITSLGLGIGIIADMGEKWYVGIALVVVGAGLSLLKYKLRETK